MTAFEKARGFIYRNARPVELARWQYLFEGGSREALITALAAYQNKDGGFGHALEADCFNPESSPIQTWCATEILRETGVDDASLPMIQGILRYLESGADFDAEHGQWLNSVPSNNDYPHAVWWHYGEQGSDFRYNPTACLAGFIIRFAKPDSALYSMGCRIAQQAFDWFAENVPFAEGHITACFIRLYEYLSKAGAQLVDMEKFAGLLKIQIEHNICRDTSKWGVEYVCMPSDFVRRKEDIFFEDYRQLLGCECDHIISSQLEDGSFAVPWLWYNDYSEYTLAANWWRSCLIINKFALLAQMGRLDRGLSDTDI